MSGIFLKVLPVILIFILGFLLKKVKLLKKANADLFLKLVFYVAVPALVIVAITNIDLSLDLIYLPITSALIILITFIVSFFIGKLLHLENKSLGVFLIGSMIINIGFTLPFVIAAYGSEGLARITLFDFANGFLVFTFIYYFAVKYGGSKKDSKAMIKKFVLSPPIWALIIALVINLTGLQLPEVANSFFEILGGMLIPLVMLSLGIYFSPKIVKFVPLSLSIIIRMFFGLFLGFVFVKLFALEGLTRVIVLVGSASPVGYNTLTFSSLEDLDKEFAASLVSYSILIGLIFTPLLIFLLS